MERVELLARPGGLPVAAGYAQQVAGGYRIYPPPGAVLGGWARGRRFDSRTAARPCC